MLTEREKAAFDKWQKMKQAGKKKFVFRTGFLMYGMTLFVVYNLAVIIINTVYNPEMSFMDFVSSVEFQQRLLTAFILFGLMGWFMGRSIWRSYQRRWEQMKNF